MDRAMADRFIELRKKAGMSQEDLADKLGVTRQAVSRWERAETSPDTDNIIALAKLYGMSVDGLLGLSGEPQKAESAANESAARRRRAHVLAAGTLVLVVAVLGAVLLLPRDKGYTEQVQGTVVAVANYRREIALDLDKMPGAEGSHLVVCDVSEAVIEPEGTMLKEGDEVTVSYRHLVTEEADDELPSRILAEEVTLGKNYVSEGEVVS